MGLARAQRHAVTSTLRLEDTSGDHLIQRCCSSRPTKNQLIRTRTRCVLNISKDWDSTRSISHCSLKKKSKRQASGSLPQFLTIIDCIELVQKGRKCLIFILPVLFAILHRIVNCDCYQYVCILRTFFSVLKWTACNPITVLKGPNMTKKFCLTVNFT